MNNNYAADNQTILFMPFFETKNKEYEKYFCVFRRKFCCNIKSINNENNLSTFCNDLFCKL